MNCADAGAGPLYAAQWALTEINGVRGADPKDLYPGAEWSWSGKATRLDAGGNPEHGPLRLEGEIGREGLLRVAARRAGRFGARVRRQKAPLIQSGGTLDPQVGGATHHSPGEPIAPLVSELSAFRRSFTVTDGRRAWAVAPSGNVPDLVLFSGETPPEGTLLWVVTVNDAERRAEPHLPSVAGFGIGTAVETPFGPTAVERLRPGDPVLTDRGSAPLRRVRLRPRVAALRMEPGVLHEAGPARAVTIGAGTHVAIEGRRLGALFGAGDGTSDGLEEALVRVADLEMLPGVDMVRSADLIALEVDAHEDGAALLMAGSVACLAGSERRAGLRCLTRAEAQIVLMQDAFWPIRTAGWRTRAA
ncbi:MAG: Hint domain-containing protein [Pseudomonadota bacterium]